MILGNVKPSAGNVTLLYSNNAVVGNLFFTNESSNQDKLRIALTSNSTYSPTSNSYILYGTTISGNYSMNISDIYIGEGQAMFVYSENGTTSFIYTGFSF
jgi:hypothetical protein